MGMFDKIFTKKQESKQQPTVEQKVADHGGITEEKLKELQQTEVMERIAKWTPKQEAAFYFLRSKALVKNVEKENITKQIADYVENFCKHNREVMPSSKFDEKTGKWEASGKYSPSLK